MKHSLLDGSDLTWLTGLARALVQEPHAADDLVQDALVASLEQEGIRQESRRAWFATVVRRLAIQRFRTQSSRAAREADVARPEAIADASELAESAELAEQVVSAARALDEPYRSTILMRFLKGLSVGEIADKERVTRDSVRRRLRDGLERMRAELQRRDGRSWSDWCLALAPLARESGRAGVVTAGASTGVFAAVTTPRFLLLTMLFVVPFLGLALFGRPDPAPSPAAAEFAATAPSLPSGSIVEPPASPTSRTGADVALVDSGDSGAESSAAPDAQIRGRLVNVNGAPLQGVSVQLKGARRPGAVLDPDGLAEAWSDLTVETGPSGEFELGFAAPPAFHYLLRASGGGAGLSNWSIASLEPGGQVDLGEVRLPPPGGLRFDLRDADGSPLDGSVLVLVRTLGETPGPHGATSGAGETYVPGASGPIVEGLPEGAVEFEFRSPSLGLIPGGRAEVRGGEVTDVIWQAEDYEPAQALQLYIDEQSGEFFEGLALSATSLISEQTGEVMGKGVALYQGLDAGTYTVRVDHPFFEPVNEPGVHPGGERRVTVRGSAAIELTVIDSATGAAVTDYGFRLSYPGSQRIEQSLELGQLDGQPEPSVYGGILPATVVLEVDGGSAGKGRLVLEALQAGAVSQLEVVLSGEPELKVRVIGSPSGQPLAGLQVAVLDGRVGTSLALGDLPGFEGARSTTDAVGQVSVRVPETDAVWIGVQLPGDVLSEQRFEAVDGSFSELQMEVPDPAVLRGHLPNVGQGWKAGRELLFWHYAKGSKEELDFEQAFARARRHGAFGFGDRRLIVPLDADGRFGPVDLAPGQWGIAVVAVGMGESERMRQMTVNRLAACPLEVNPGAEIEMTFEDIFPDPARLLGSVLIDGEPAAGARFELTSEAFVFAREKSLDGAGFADAEIEPDTYWARLELGTGLPGSRTLYAPLGDPWTLASGQIHDATVQLETVERGLVIRYANGTPVLDARVEIGGAAGPEFLSFSGGFGLEARELWLGVGRYRVEVDREVRAEFDWVEGEGPLEVVLAD